MQIVESYVTETEGSITIWLFNTSPWKITMLLIGKPSISIRAIYKSIPWLC